MTKPLLGEFPAFQSWVGYKAVIYIPTFFNALSIWPFLQHLIMPQPIQNPISTEIFQAKLGNVTTGQSPGLIGGRVRKGWVTIFMRFMSPGLGRDYLHSAASPRFAPAELPVRHSGCSPSVAPHTHTPPYLSLTREHLARELPGEQQADLIITFHLWSVSGGTARKKNINRRARLLQIIQTILFQVDIWHKAPSQFSWCFPCPFVTWATAGQSLRPCRCVQKLP